MPSPWDLNDKPERIHGFRNYERKQECEFIVVGNIFMVKMHVFLIFSMCILSKGMEFHEELRNLGAKEGLKGRKLNKAIESFAWNITVLKVHELPRCPFPFLSLLSSPGQREASAAKYGDLNFEPREG